MSHFKRQKLRGQFSENLELLIYECLLILAIEFPKKKNYGNSENSTFKAKDTL